MSKKSKTTTVQDTSSSSKQTLDPAIRNAVFGADGTGGYVGSLVNTFNNNPIQAYQGPTYAGFNPTQQGALQGTLGYLNSGAGNAGYNALNSAGNALMGSQAGQLNLPGVSAQQVGGNGIDMSQFGGGITAPKVGGVSVGGSGFNYGDAINRILKGEVENPQLRGMMQNTADVSTENFMRNVAPQLRGGAIAAGGYGGSRSGIAEGLATSDLNNQIQRSNTSLLGGLYESAQDRMSGMAGQLAGQDAQARIASAQMRQQANLANAGFDLQGQLANLQNRMQGAQFNAGLNQNAQLANQGANLQAAGMNQSGQLAQFGLNQDAQQRALMNQLQGAQTLQGASQIPLQNYQTALNVGNAYQGDQNAQYQDAYRRFQEQQMAPWQTQQLYGSLLSPFATLGSGQDATSHSNTVQRTSSSDPLGTAIGIGSMLAAPFTGGASLAFGQSANALAGGGGLGGMFGGFSMPSIFSSPSTSLGSFGGGNGGY